MAASGAVGGLVVVAVVGTGAGHVPGHLTMMAQFIFMTASFYLRVDPRWCDQGVSAMYQYEFNLWELSTGVAWLPSDGATEFTI